MKTILILIALSVVLRRDDYRRARRASSCCKGSQLAGSFAAVPGSAGAGQHHLCAATEEHVEDVVQRDGAAARSAARSPRRGARRRTSVRRSLVRSPRCSSPCGRASRPGRPRASRPTSRASASRRIGRVRADRVPRARHGAGRWNDHGARCCRRRPCASTAGCSSRRTAASACACASCRRRAAAARLLLHPLGLPAHLPVRAVRARLPAPGAASM